MFSCQLMSLPSSVLCFSRRPWISLMTSPIMDFSGVIFDLWLSLVFSHLAPDLADNQAPILHSGSIPHLMFLILSHSSSPGVIITHLQEYRRLPIVMWSPGTQDSCCPPAFSPSTLQTATMWSLQTSVVTCLAVHCLEPCSVGLCMQDKVQCLPEPSASLCDIWIFLQPSWTNSLQPGL